MATLVADDHYIAGSDALLGDGRHGVFFRFENPCWPAVAEAFMAADFGDAALGREVATQNHQTSRLLQRLVQRRNHFLTRRLHGASGLRSYTLSAYRHRAFLWM